MKKEAAKKQQISAQAPQVEPPTMTIPTAQDAAKSLAAKQADYKRRTDELNQ